MPAWQPWRRRWTTDEVGRWREKIVPVDGSECWWWTGAISGRGHGRFYFAPGRVIIAQRFAFGLVHGVEALDQVRVLGHRCDNPLCHLGPPRARGASSYAENRREWAARRELSGSPLGDPRGARRRARVLRELAREDPALIAADLVRSRALYGEPLTLW